MSEAKKISGHGNCKATEVEYHQPMRFVDQKSELILNFDSALAPLSVGAVKIWTVDEPSTSQLVPVEQTAEPEMTSEDQPKILSLVGDCNLPQVRTNLPRTSCYGTSWAQPTVRLQLIPGNWDLATNQLAELQIHRQSLYRTARSLSKNLASVDLFIGSGWNAVGVEVKANASVGAQLGVWTSMGAAAIEG